MEPTRSKPSRGFISKSKLVKSLYWPNKPKPTPMGFIIMNHDQAYPQQTPKVAVVAVTAERAKHGSYGRMVESLYGEDEAVDVKAAKYISRVHESFRLERVGSERMNLDDLRI